MTRPADVGAEHGERRPERAAPVGDARLSPDTPRAGPPVAAGLLLGVGLGGFVDGILLHQVLQWHHLLTAYGSTAGSRLDVGTLQDNTTWDGAFHAATWAAVLTGVVLLWRGLSAGRRMTGAELLGLMLAGWGGFNVVEGVVNHHLLSIHHVRDDVGGPLSWDLGFLAIGGALVGAGALVFRRSTRRRRA